MIIKLLFFPLLTSFWYPLSIARSIHLPPQKESASYRIELSAWWEPCTPGSPLLSGVELHGSSWVTPLPVSLLTYQGLHSFLPQWRSVIPPLLVEPQDFPPEFLHNLTCSIGIPDTSVVSTLKSPHVAVRAIPAKRNGKPRCKSGLQRVRNLVPCSFLFIHSHTHPFFHFHCARDEKKQCHMVPPCVILKSSRRN